MRTGSGTSNQRGQALTETVITLALIAIATISVVTLFGNNLRSLFGVSGDALAGQTAVPNRATTAPQGITQKTLQTFGQNDPGLGGGGSGGSGGSGGPGRSGGTSEGPDKTGGRGGGVGGGGAPPTSFSNN